MANFLEDVKNYNFSLGTDDPNKNSEFLTSLFINMHLWKEVHKEEIELLFWLDTLRKKSVLEVDLQINFVKSLLKKIKNCIKSKETNMLLLGRNV